MENHQDIGSRGFERAQTAMRHLQSLTDTPDLSGRGTESPKAWFLGPKAENARFFEELVTEAVRDQSHWRRNFHPGDPVAITESDKRQQDYVEAIGKTKEDFLGLLAFLKRSVPFFSMRYQGHMNWDLTLPGMLGYFAAMLYNPNNVAFEGSTATTILEVIVGDDICRMLGYDIPDSEDSDSAGRRPWGHITCDGTVANIEAMWSARNVKYYAMAFREALANEESLAAARDIRVLLPTGASKRLLELSSWELLNLQADVSLSLSPRLTDEFGVSRDAISAAIAPYSLQNLGIAEFSRRYLSANESVPVILVPGTKHYSFPKAAAALGLGADQLVDVPVDLDARMSIMALRQELERCIAEKRPVISVVSVIGSTEESAIDPIADVLRLRGELEAQHGFSFTVHADAAWGGYHRSVLNPDFSIQDPLAEFEARTPVFAPLSGYVEAQFAALGRADSITVDPHKSGYIPYPAGALCYRNSGMRDLVSFSAPVVFHGDAEPTVGIYGIEGSKPGAAAAAVYLSHRVIRPSRSGYGQIISQALFSCRKLYARLLTMSDASDPFSITPLPRLPAERTGGDILAQREQVRRLIDEQESTSIVANAAGEMDLLREIGPDENILAYAFNLKLDNFEPNRDIALANAFNKRIYEMLSIDPGDDIYGYNLIVSTTDISEEHYGAAFMHDYTRRLGVQYLPDTPITVLRSVVMDPWVATNDFVAVLEREFRKAANAARADLLGTHGRGA